MFLFLIYTLRTHCDLAFFKWTCDMTVPLSIP